MPFSLINQCWVLPPKISLTFSFHTENQWTCGWSPAEMLPIPSLAFLPQVFWFCLLHWIFLFFFATWVRNKCAAQKEDSSAQKYTHPSPFTWTHPLNPYSAHYPHCFADCLLSPVLAQPAMEGVEVRWRPAVGSSLAPLSLCSWLLCASGVFVTVSLSVVLCLIPKFHVSEVVPLKLAYDAPMALWLFFQEPTCHFDFPANVPQLVTVGYILQEGRLGFSLLVITNNHCDAFLCSPLQEMRICSAIINLFHLIPAAPQTLVKPLLEVVMKTERAMLIEVQSNLHAKIHAKCMPAKGNASSVCLNWAC